MNDDARRELPAVHEVIRALGAHPFPHAVAVNEARKAIEQARAALRDGQPAPDPVAIAGEALNRLAAPSLRRVINATGVILHTNLGRAPLPGLAPVDGYSNLEFDLDAGRRGRRDTHVASLLERLLGAPGIVVNNNAAAVYLVLHELARDGEVIVSRGELIEIGDGFRVPDIMASSGARLREVGTTNRTRIEDYAAACTPQTRLILLVHPSNFRIEGFAAKPARSEIVDLAARLNVPVYEDLGSGCLADVRPYGVHEPRPQDSLAAGVSLVSFSGDKLLGGPQAGILAGQPDLVARLRRNPMFRALRVDKMVYSALETVLRHTLLQEWDCIPTLRMLALDPDRVRARAEALSEGLPAARVIPGESVLGGGSTPGQAIPTWVIAIQCDAAKVDARLRRRALPVIARIESGCILIDLRTVAEPDEPELRRALAEALEAAG
jgi:L-seryl-tRNA(Ser) seleniumtransferase